MGVRMAIRTRPFPGQRRGFRALGLMTILAWHRCMLPDKRESVARVSARWQALSGLRKRTAATQHEQSRIKRAATESTAREGPQRMPINT
jgi:hypothetical protein